MSAIASAVFNRLVPSYPRMTFALTVAATDLLLDALRQRDIELVMSRLTDSVNTRISPWTHCFMMSWL